MLINCMAREVRAISAMPHQVDSALVTGSSFRTTVF